MHIFCDYFQQIVSGTLLSTLHVLFIFPNFFPDIKQQLGVGFL